MNSTDILMKFPAGRDLIIEALDGSENFSNSEIFNIWLDQDFKGSCFSGSTAKSDKVEVVPYQLASDANFKEIFDFFKKDLKNFSFTQHQIIHFCKKYLKKLDLNGYTLFFLLEEGNNYFVVFIGVYSTGLSAIVGDLYSTHIWKPKDPRLIMTPKFSDN